MANSLGRIKTVAAAICLMLVLACAGAGPTEPPQPETLAIWDLEDLSVSPRVHAGMGELLAGQIASRLGQTGLYKVVERQQLIKALEELHIGSSELADAQTRLRLGGMLGARQMVFGAFQAVGPMLRLDLRLVDVASGRILSTATATTNIQDIGGWLQAAERAAGDLVKP